MIVALIEVGASQLAIARRLSGLSIPAGNRLQTLAHSPQDALVFFRVTIEEDCWFVWLDSGSKY